MKVIQKLLLAVALLLSGTVLWAQTVNINTADAEELAAVIKGVGPKTARAIVAYRQQHGPFRTVEELVKVKGVGQVTIDKNRPRLTVGDRQARQE